VAIIQARMGSTRLPGKVLADLAGMPVLARVVHRARRSRRVDQVVVATSRGPADDAVAGLCSDLAVPCFRGSEEDVLERFRDAAREHRAEAVVRLTADCPLLDPAVVDQVVEGFLAGRPDYASNTLERSWPRGLDTEVLTRDALETAAREALEPYQRAHVTPFLYQHPERFRLLPVVAPEDWSGLRWTVDTPEDLALVRELYRRLGDRGDFGFAAALAEVRADPQLAEWNRAVRQKDLSEA
jgi:spore coat polysaccharide biosynthesis protein SpsF